MIAKLAGLLDSADEGSAIIDVGGVGYQVFCSARTLRALPRAGEPVRLLIDTHVREDHIHLYGFLERAEQDWFATLQSVQGVGARLALSILSTLGPSELLQAIAAQDKAALSRASGVGGKLALRLITELRDKAGDIALGAVAQVAGQAAGAGGSAADAISALVNLGYKRAEAFSAVATAARNLGPQASVEVLIRSGLQELSR